jgi:AcrR family transcriptional regulator
MSIKEEKKLDTSTEEKIKAAARTVFLRKGFAAARTRDIADESGINLALLNYYFRSKAKLFDVVMGEVFSGFVKDLTVIFNQEETTLNEKVSLLAEKYIDFVIKEPEIPTFLISEIRSNPQDLLKRLPIKHVLTRAVFFRQYMEAVQKGEVTESNPLHFLMNLMGMILFPFVARPIILGARDLKNEEFDNLMRERKKLIPIWIKAMMEAK